MKNGNCPKCGKKEVYYKHNRSFASSNIWITDFNEAATTIYICLHCGFVEFYFEHEKDLHKIILSSLACFSLGC